MRKVLIAVALLAPLACFAEPLVTITCESLLGQGQKYGVIPAEAMKAASERKSPPANHLTAPIEDGIYGKPTFILDTSRKKLTLVWADPPPGPAREALVMAYSPVVITAVDAHPGPNGATWLYSFYPKLGVVFAAQHYMNIDGSYAAQSALFAKCKFLWSGTP
jgi:hypothetical protein